MIEKMTKKNDRKNDQKKNRKHVKYVHLQYTSE